MCTVPEASRWKGKVWADPKTSVSFRRPRVGVSVPVKRTEFESVIERNLAAVDGRIDSALLNAGVEADDIDLVIRTGGSSRIPLFVRRLEERFGAHKVAERDAFSTVSLGLASRAGELWR
jgi:hypothetical chaperone protein